MQKEGHFKPGSMGPKVEACCRFAEAGGNRAIIASLMERTVWLRLQHGLKMAGATRTIFTHGAIRLIHNYSRGIPRVINNPCTAPLLDVCAHEGNLVEPDNAQRAINELGDQ